MITFVDFKTEDRFHELELQQEWVGTVEDLKEEIEDIAQECAEQDWNDHDGWESKWPKTFSIFSDGELLGFVKVGMEMEPSFSATHITP